MFDSMPGASDPVSIALSSPNRDHNSEKTKKNTVVPAKGESLTEMRLLPVPKGSK